MRIHLNFCHICSVFLMLLTCLRSFLFLAPTRALPYYITLSSWYIREKETSEGLFYFIIFLPSCWGFLNMTGRISQALMIAFLRSGKMYFSDIFKRISVISSPVASLSCISLALACSCLQCCSRFPAQLGIRWGNCICQFID